MCFLFSFVANIVIWLFFFFQAEDGIRDADVTGVQTCALPIFDVAVEIPGSYRAAPGTPSNRPPKLDWWRDFRSKELTDLMEEAQAANFDIAAAIARIVQADAASKIAGAPLFPSVDFNASATRTRSSQATGNSSSTGGGGSERATY